MYKHNSISRKIKSTETEKDLSWNKVETSGSETLVKEISNIPMKSAFDTARLKVTLAYSKTERAAAEYR